MSDPSAQTSDEVTAAVSGAGPRRWIRIAGFLAGLCLLGGAIWTAAAMQNDLARTARALSGAPRGVVALLLLLPLANYVITALVFLFLTRRSGRVGAGEMFALIGAGWLLNYVPLGSGLAGRVAYHKAFNGIRVRDSARAAVESIVLGLLAAATLFALVVVPRHLGQAGAWVVYGAALVLFVIFRLVPRDGGVYAGVYLLKLLDAQLWAFRYGLLFEVSGRVLDGDQAVLLATISQLATMIPFVGNGLGIREWLIGLASAGLPVAAAAAPITLASGLSVELFNRIIELFAALVVGVPAWIWLSRRIGRGLAGPSAPAGERAG